MGKKYLKTTKYYWNETFAKALGERCKEMRQKKGYTIDRMAREGVKLSPGAIQRLENGTHDVRVSLVLRYASVLGVQLGTLFKFPLPIVEEE